MRPGIGSVERIAASLSEGDWAEALLVVFFVACSNSFFAAILLSPKCYIFIPMKVNVPIADIDNSVFELLIQYFSLLGIDFGVR